jgi:hypothetical protein
MSLITVIENDLKAAGTWLESEAEVIGSEVWTIFKTIWASLNVEEWNVLIGIVQSVLNDIENNEIGDIVQDVIERAEVSGADFVKDLSEGVLNMIVSVFKQKQSG